MTLLHDLGVRVQVAGSCVSFGRPMTGPAPRVRCFPRRIRGWPTRWASSNPALQQYLDLFKQYLPGGNAKALLGAQGFSACLLFTQAAQEFGADLTRLCAYNNLNEGPSVDCSAVIVVVGRPARAPRDAAEARFEPATSFVSLAATAGFG